MGTVLKVIGWLIVLYIILAIISFLLYVPTFGYLKGVNFGPEYYKDRGYTIDVYDASYDLREEVDITVITVDWDSYYNDFPPSFTVNRDDTRLSNWSTPSNDGLRFLGLYYQDTMYVNAAGYIVRPLNGTFFKSYTKETAEKQQINEYHFQLVAKWANG